MATIYVSHPKLYPSDALSPSCVFQGWIASVSTNAMQVRRLIKYLGWPRSIPAVFVQSFGLEPQQAAVSF